MCVLVPSLHGVSTGSLLILHIGYACNITVDKVHIIVAYIHVHTFTNYSCHSITINIFKKSTMFALY